MAKDEISLNVRMIVARCIIEPLETVRLSDDFRRDLRCDSLDMVEITMDCEERFSLEGIPDEDVEGVRTVSDLVALVERHLQGKAS